MLSQSPFHAGEQEVQTRLGVRDVIEPWARQVVRPYLSEEHRRFHTSLPFLVAAARDKSDRPWVTLLTGPPDFVRSPGPHYLQIDTHLIPGDALEDALDDGAHLGLLGIELQTRRRNRVNGRIVDDGSKTIVLEVDQAFGNCPQYIHPRAFERVPAPTNPVPARRSTRLSASMRQWISNADTFFIASGHTGEDDHTSHGMDASHRGGEPGFVYVADGNHLVFPDYAGNNHFNTIGNLIVDPRAGLTFVDFERGSLLQLTGHTSIDWDSEAVARFPGARRLVSFQVEQVVELETALPLRWSAPSNTVRTLRLVDKVRESEEVVSFVFESRDGGPLAEFDAGQHLPIELDIPDHAVPIRRTYSLSSGSGSGHYRISVKREAFGVASRYLHDEVGVGEFVNAHLPAGDFTLSKSRRPVVLISAGIGLTPLVSMLHQLSANPTANPVWFLHGARDGGHHALADEVRTLVATNKLSQLHVAYTRPRAQDLLGSHYHSTGRLDAQLIEQLLPDLDADYYVCGPTRFMADIQLGLIQRGVSENCIHTETFGPVG